ncbi:MAG: YhcN/YlaJ family sporulation lipoprotein [Firmicutes bacterium]|nr:YhcN/YlaJ family sporulation lipoprotein [Bacillota bacterium]
MKKTFKSLSILTLIILILASLTIACQPQEKPNPNDDYDMEDNNMNNNMDMDNMEMNNNDLSSRAETIANSVVDLSEVNDATVVITNNTALVGVNVTGNRDMLDAEMRDRVRSVVKNVDNDIDRVVVTADTTMFDRIDNIAQNINRGRNVTDYRDEIDNMLENIDSVL